MRFSILLFLFFLWACFLCTIQIKEKTKDLSNFQTAYFASGCFWCVEAIFESVVGVEEVVSGYSGGKEKNPLMVRFLEAKLGMRNRLKYIMILQKVKYSDLLRVFFSSHDPTTYHQQGPDKGSQYRSVVFYKNEREKRKLNRI